MWHKMYKLFNLISEIFLLKNNNLDNKLHFINWKISATV